MKQCHICGRWFSSQKAIYAHILRYHDVKKPGDLFDVLWNPKKIEYNGSCPLCSEEIKDRDLLLEHLKVKHRCPKMKIKRWLKI